MDTKFPLLRMPADTPAEVIERPLPSAQELGAALEAAFSQAAQAAVADALQAGVAVAVAVGGHVAWLHPDGQIYPEQNPVRGVFGMTSGSAE